MHLNPALGLAGTINSITMRDPEQNEITLRCLHVSRESHAHFVQVNVEVPTHAQEELRCGRAIPRIVLASVQWKLTNDA